MVGLGRALLFAAVSLGMLEVLENLQNDFSGAIVRAHISDDDRSRLLDINGTLAANLGRQRNKKPVDAKELKSTMKDIDKLVKKQDFTREDAAALEKDLADLKAHLRH